MPVQAGNTEAVEAAVVVAALDGSTRTCSLSTMRNHPGNATRDFGNLGQPGTLASFMRPCRMHLLQCVTILSLVHSYSALTAALRCAFGASHMHLLYEHGALENAPSSRADSGGR